MNRMKAAEGEPKYLDALHERLVEAEAALLELRVKETKAQEQSLGRLVSIASDINAGHKLNRASFQKVLDQAQEGVLLAGEDSKVLLASEALLRWSGKKARGNEELKLGSLLGCIHAAANSRDCGTDLNCAACRIQQATKTVLSTGKPVQYAEAEVLARLGEGEPEKLWLDINADVFVLGGQRLALLVLNDVTARAKAEQALLQVQALLKQQEKAGKQELSEEAQQVRSSQSAEQDRKEEELQTSLEEMQVVQEELYSSNEGLQAAKVLLESERTKYQHLFDFAPVIYVTTDISGVIREANKAALNLLRGLNSRLEGLNLAEFFSEDDRPSFIYWLYQLQNLENIKHWETTLQLPTGISREVSISAARVQDPNDETIDLHWLIADISERKKAEARIRVQTQAMEATANGIMITDREGRIEWCNPAFEAVTGYSPEEAAGRTPRFLKSGRQSKEFYMRMWETLLKGQTWHGEIVNRRKDGQLYMEEETITPVRNEKDEITHFIAIKQDITSRKQAEQALKQAYAYNRSLIEASLDPLATITPDGKIGDVNSAMEKVTGRRREELVGTDFHSYFSDPAKARQAYLKVFESGSAHDFELEICHKDGHLTPVLYNGSFYRSEEGNVEGVFAVARDITDRKQFENQLMLAEKHAVIGRMMGSVTHEINNPLQTIKNCLYLIRQDTLEGSPQLEPLEMAASETARVTKLVGQLREVYRPQTESIEMPYDLFEIIEEVHALLLPHLNHSKVKWKAQAGVRNILVSCVRDQILEVFLNISMNSIEAMQARGGSLFVDMLFKEGQVGVTFRDTGPGITAEIFPHLFEPFQTTKSNGLGLGLSICYGIVQRYGGNIQAENSPEGGAEFTIWLPVSSEAGKERSDAEGK